MDILTPPSVSAQTSIRPVCARDQHVWLSGGFGSWVVCERCGFTGICKACEAEQGLDIVRLPDIFCAAHDQPTIRQGYRRAISFQGIFLRLVFLAGAVPGSAWQVDDSNLLSVKQLVSVTMPGYRVEYLHIPASQDYWEVQVFAPENDESPAFHAVGQRKYPAKVLSAQMGAWTQAVVETITLREGAWACR